MTDLSPAAQAVLDAYCDFESANVDAMAAAIRALACYSKRDTLFLLAIADELDSLQVTSE